MEVWKTVTIGDKTYKGYEVSQKGRVKSLNRKVGHNYGGFKIVKERVLKLNSTNPHGYSSVVLSVENIQRTCLVHRLVAEAFLGRIGEKEVNHKDGNKLNNLIENLEIVTKSENILHSRRILGKCIGEKSSSAKLSKVQVDEIRSILADNPERGVQQMLAELYGVSKYAISDIKRGKSWK